MSNETVIQKPPIGVCPNHIWKVFLENPEEPPEIEIKHRIERLESAIERYKNSPYPPRPEWQFEIDRHELFLAWS